VVRETEYYRGKHSVFGNIEQLGQQGLMPEMNGIELANGYGGFS
jgi:hypothetical protein